MTPTVVQRCKPWFSIGVVHRGTGADDRGHPWSASSGQVQAGLPGVGRDRFCWGTAERHGAGTCRETGSGGRRASRLGGGSAGGLGAPEGEPGGACCSVRIRCGLGPIRGGWSSSSASLCGVLGGGLAGGVPGGSRGAASVA